MPDFYSYLQEKDDEDVIAYSFVTDNGSLYYVYFDPYQYVGYTNVYPNLLSLGYGFGFHRPFKPDGSWPKDEKIGATISKIISDFIEENGDEVVLLYHCDHEDSKQRGRNLIFNRWYNTTDIQATILKQSIKIDQVTESGDDVEMHMGYLTSRDNPLLHDVKKEFLTFAENLTSYKTPQ